MDKKTYIKQIVTVTEIKISEAFMGFGGSATGEIDDTPQ